MNTVKDAKSDDFSPWVACMYISMYTYRYTYIHNEYIYIYMSDVCESQCVLAAGTKPTSTCIYICIYIHIYIYIYICMYL